MSTPSSLYFGCWDRPDLRPEEYGAAPSPLTASAPARLASEQNSRRSVFDATVRKVEDLKQALLALRRFDSTGNADLALDHVLATEGQLRAQLRVFVTDVEGVYAKFADEPLGPVSEPVPAPEPASEPVQAPAPVSAPPRSPSPADFARRTERRAS